MGSIIPIQTTVNSGNTVSIDVAFADILTVKREGIGYKLREQAGGTETVEGEAFTYERVSTTGAVPSGINFVKAVHTDVGFAILERFTIGGSVIAGYTYSLTGDGVTVSYTTTGADTQATVKSAIINAVNAATYPSGTVTAEADGITIKIYIYFAGALTPSVVGENQFLYQSGRVTSWDGEFYLSEGNQSNSSMPPVSSASDPYDYDDLTLLPDGLAAFLYTLGYSTLSYSETSEGTVNIDNVPVSGASVPDDGETVLIGGGLLTFLNDFSSDGEMITILYKT